jgi:glyoxylase-like metal-dependent hydrolase (beta-lactamase superfamily II)
MRVLLLSSCLFVGGLAQAANDGHRIDLAGRELVLLHTPGHALHHYCVWDARRPPKAKSARCST